MDRVEDAEQDLLVQDAGSVKWKRARFYGYHIDIHVCNTAYVRHGFTASVMVLPNHPHEYLYVVLFM